MIRFRNGSSNHSILVTGIDDQYIYFGDCNGTAQHTCKIQWDRKKLKTTIMNNLISIRYAPTQLQP